MIKMYVSYLGASYRNAVNLFKEHNITYKRINLAPGVLQPKDVIEMLLSTENGLEDIITKVSYRKYKIDSMHMDEAIQFIIDNPVILRCPIIMEGTKLQIGYHREETQVFLPRSERELATW